MFQILEPMLQGLDRIAACHLEAPFPRLLPKLPRGHGFVRLAQQDHHPFSHAGLSLGGGWRRRGTWGGRRGRRWFFSWCRGGGRQGGDFLLDLLELILEFFLAACQLAEMALSGLQFLAQGFQLTLALGDLLLEIGEGGRWHDYVKLQDKKADNKTLIIQGSGTVLSISRGSGTIGQEKSTKCSD